MKRCVLAGGADINKFVKGNQKRGFASIVLRNLFFEIRLHFAILGQLYYTRGRSRQ